LLSCEGRPKKKRLLSVVGSPEYIAPEILEGQGYDETVDYWSLGCILYECLTGSTPFYANTVKEIFENVWNWRKMLTLPKNESEEPLISAAAWDLIKRLLCPRGVRLGRHNFNEVKSLAFFNGVDWNDVRNQTPFFVPQLEDEFDTSYFDHAPKFETNEELESVVDKELKNNAPYQKLSPSNNPAFIGFTFNLSLLKSNSTGDVRTPPLSPLGSSSSSTQDTFQERKESQ